MQENPDQKSSEEEVPPPPPDLGGKLETFGVSDALTILIIFLAIGGFWFWYHSARASSAERFRAADALWQRRDYVAAGKLYGVLQEKSHFISKKDDTTMTHRLDKLGEWEDNARILNDGVSAAIVSSDTSLMRAARVKVASDTNVFVNKAALLTRLDSALTKGK